MAYAALVCLAQKLEKINQDPDHLFHTQHQNHLLFSLHANVVELLAIMENFPAKTRGLEGRIADTAHHVDDAIDAYFSNYFSSHRGAVNRTLDGFSENWVSLQQEVNKVVNETTAILEEANRFDGVGGKEVGQAIQSPHNVGRSRDPLRAKDSIVGFDLDLKMLKERIYGDSSQLQVIPIVGMGGSGKTTLATALYEDGLKKGHFDLSAWITVSQNYNLRGALSRLWGDIKGTEPEDHETASIESLGLRIYQGLKKRRFLIVIDDIWSEKFWDHVKIMLPDDDKRSRILVTTRLEDVAAYTVDSGCSIHKVELLDLERSWCLLKKKVFGEDICPVELEETGKTIAKFCGGLPLAIIVVAGLLSNVDLNEDSWRNIADNVGTTITSNSEQILGILRLSYCQLPHHLKPCFLYIGMFPGNTSIRVSRLIKLWVAEGFLKPIRSQVLEETAHLYFEDLVRRNLIFVSQRGSVGRVRLCWMHDLIRDLCVKTAQQEQFLHLLDDNTEFSGDGISNPRRLSVSSDGSIHDLDYSSVRSIWYVRCHRDTLVPFMSFRLLRVLDALRIVFSRFPREVCQLFHLRYFAFTHKKIRSFVIPACIHKLQNLQVLIITSSFNLFSSSYNKLVLPLDTWRIAELRHLFFREKTILPEPPSRQSNPSLRNLQTLSQVVNLRFTKEVVEMIPNIKKLRIFYSGDDAYPKWDEYCLENVTHLLHLETLSLASEWDRWFPFWKNMKLPQSLIKLSLTLTRIPWSEIGEIAGTLPNLEVLKLRQNACVGQIWETKEGEFPKLKILEIDDSFPDTWRSDDSSHFPRLEQLCMYNIRRIGELPSCIGDIETLQLIEVDSSNEHIVEWAKEMQEEQLSLGNELLQIRLHSWVSSNKFMRKLAYKKHSEY